ncbi:MAG: flagellar basal body-associated FliL family protein [Pseudomonadota bacterium]
MKKYLKWIVVALVLLGGAGGAAWYFLRPKPAPGGAAVVEEKKTEKEAHKYITLDKVVIMLRRGPDDGESHYLSTDLVITTTDKQEKMVKEHLPLLRSVAVKALAGYSIEKASGMTVEQYAELINLAFDAHYKKEKADKPFSEVMIGKLIIE